jgi:hypothetical protein
MVSRFRSARDTQFTVKKFGVCKIPRSCNKEHINQRDHHLSTRILEHISVTRLENQRLPVSWTHRRDETQFRFRENRGHDQYPDLSSRNKKKSSKQQSILVVLTVKTDADSVNTSNSPLNNLHSAFTELTFLSSTWGEEDKLEKWWKMR